jgi:hypothetical protein
MGTSNIDLTIISPHLIRNISGWEISDQESISDHNIIKYAIGPGIGQWEKVNTQNPQYITNKENLAKFQEQVLQIVKTQLNKKHDTGIENLDDTLSSIITDELDIEKRIDEIHDVIKLACNKTFPTRGPKNTVTTQNSYLVDPRADSTAKKNKRPT